MTLHATPPTEWVPALAVAAESNDDEPSALIEWMMEQGFPELFVDVVDGIVEPLTKTVVIVVLAWLASLLIRRAIGKVVDEMKDPDTHHRLGLIKKRIRMGDLAEGERPYSERRVKRADALGALLRSVASGLVWTIAFFMILGAFEIDLAPLLAGAGIAGIAIGFGAQQLVQDFLSGVFMLVEDQYGLGDIINVGEATGVVEGVGLRSTRIRDVEGTLWHVPNGEIRRVGNMSQQWARVLLDVDVAYDTNLDEAMALILDVATRMSQEEEYADKFLDVPEMWGVNNFGPDGISLRLVIKTQPAEQWALGRQLRRRLKMAFDEAGIEIPFPQRTMWMRSEGSEPLPVIALSGESAEPAASEDPPAAT